MVAKGGMQTMSAEIESDSRWNSQTFGEAILCFTNTIRLGWTIHSEVSMASQTGNFGLYAHVPYF